MKSFTFFTAIFVLILLVSYINDVSCKKKKKSKSREQEIDAKADLNDPTVTNIHYKDSADM